MWSPRSPQDVVAIIMPSSSSIPLVFILLYMLSPSEVDKQSNQEGGPNSDENHNNNYNGQIGS